MFHGLGTGDRFRVLGMFFDAVQIACVLAGLAPGGTCEVHARDEVLDDGGDGRDGDYNPPALRGH
jgi:hypothetical protein